MNEEPKSLAEANGWTYSQRVEGAYERLLAHLEWLRKFEQEELQLEAKVAAERREEIAQESNESLKEFWQNELAQSAELSTNSIDDFVRVSYEGVIGILNPIFGDGAVEAAVERIRKEFS